MAKTTKKPTKKAPRKASVKKVSQVDKSKHAFHAPRSETIKGVAVKLLKVVALLAVSFVVFLFVIWIIFGRTRAAQPEEIVWGTTWSNLAAEELGLDPEVAYRAVVEDLKPSRLRLVAYWNRTEAEQGVFDFSELDFQIDLAEEHNIPYVISVGNRVPRYPECHTPDWAHQLSGEDYKTEILAFLEATVTRYDANPGLTAWQVENEAFVGSFGICPPLNEELLKTEVDHVRSLTEKKVILTESGELSLWFKASGYPDYLGTTLYRTVIIGKTDIVVRHVFPPWYYRARSNIVKLLNGNLENVIVAELQGEPWASKPIIDADQAQLDATMSQEQFERNIEFTESVGFPEVWWWGVEWWYYESQNGDDYYWERARELFRQSDLEI